jgi:hypothetical protein
MNPPPVRQGRKLAAPCWPALEAIELPLRSRMRAIANRRFEAAAGASIRGLPAQFGPILPIA